MSSCIQLGVVVLFFFASLRADAEAPAQGAADELRRAVERLTQTVERLQETVQAQQRRITELEQRGAAQPVPASAVTAPAVARPSAAASLSAFNPEIGVVADIVGMASERSTEGEGNDKLSAREVELVFGHPIDPYSRLDVTVALSDFEETALEEAYVTHWGLPLELKARIGRMRPRIGKAGAAHRDSLDTADEPLVVERYLGAEGLSRTGVELSGFVPAPWTALTHELIAGMMEGGVGEGATLFGEARRRPSFYAHLKNFWDVSDATNAELGGTYLVGSKDADPSFEVHAFGLDATLTHFVTPTNKLKWQNEAYVQHRDESVAFATDERTEDVTSTSVHNTPWGFYSLLDYRLSPRFGLGGRFDYVEPVDVDPERLIRDADTAWSSYLTFYQSEFARWRLQYRHTNFAEGGDDNSLFVQGTVAIGVHKHQIQ